MPDLSVPRSRATKFSWTSHSENLKHHIFNSKRYNFHQNRPSDLKVMIDFQKFLNKYVGANLDHVSPRRSYNIALRGRNSPSLQAMCVISCGRSAFPALEPPAGPPKLNFTEFSCVNHKNLSNIADLELAHSRATEFSWTSHSQNLKLHIFNSKRYKFHQNRPNELKVMIDFQKFWNKFVGANLDHVSPRRSYIIALPG